jgi:hypothetical protein
MSARNFQLGLLVTALMAGTATTALAWPFKKDLSKVELPDEQATELQLEYDPSWLEPGKQPAIAGSPSELGTLPTTPSAASAAFSPSATQSAIERAIKNGYAVGATPDQFPAEMNRGYSVTESFKTSVRAGFNAPVGDDMLLTEAGADARLTLGQIAPAISWGWHTGVDMTTQATGTNAIESGPQFRFGSNQLALTFTPKMTHNFGEHHESQTAFAYAAGLKGEVVKDVSLGVEAFGSSAETAVVPGTALQTHRGSPGIYVGLGLAPQPLGNDSKFSLELGALADVGETQADWTGQLKAAVTW